MKATARGRTRPSIQPISTDHANDVSRRLIPVRGELPATASPLQLSPSYGQAEVGATPTSSTTLAPLSASIYTRGGVFPDAFIIPIDLPKRLRPILRSSTRFGQVTSPLPDNGSFTVRVVVHSNNRHFGLTRQFDVNILRATIPDGLSPRTPTLDEGFSLAALEGYSASPLIDSPEEALTYPPSSGAVTASPGSSPLSDREARLGYRALPIDIHFARAHLPALASIMMSNQVRRGSTIELPVPHPSAWKNTMMYVYTGNQDFATNQVKRNILYLGGKVQASVYNI